LLEILKSLIKTILFQKFWDKKLFSEVSFEIAKAAIETGVARKKIDFEKYKKSLKKKIL